LRDFRSQSGDKLCGMTSIEPIFAPTVRGTFYRAIDPNFREVAIAGSRSNGRYSRAEEPTLYLSSSADGVEAATIAHTEARAEALEVIELDVASRDIIDLRDPHPLEAIGVTLADSLAPWQDLAAAGGTPSSWRVRDRLIEAG